MGCQGRRDLKFKSLNTGCTPGTDHRCLRETHRLPLLCDLWRAVIWDAGWSQCLRAEAEQPAKVPRLGSAGEREMWEPAS